MDNVKTKQSGAIAVYDSYEDYKNGKAPKNVSKFGDEAQEGEAQNENQNQDKEE